MPKGIVSCMPRTPKAAQGYSLGLLTGCCGIHTHLSRSRQERPCSLQGWEAPLGFHRLCRPLEEATAILRKLRPIIRNDTEAPELWGSTQQQPPQCMCDSVTIGHKRATDDVLLGPPQKRPTLEAAHFRHPGFLGHRGHRERRVMARRSTARGDTWQAPVHVADGINGGGLVHNTGTGRFIAFVESTHPPAEKWSSRGQTTAFPGNALRPPSCPTLAAMRQTST
jgi:hypothetical protein